MSQTEAKTIANSFKWLHKHVISPNNRAYYEYEYHKNSNIIRTIFTKNRGPVAGLRVIHVN